MPIIPYMGICFLAILTNQAEIFCGNYYLSIASVKSMLWHLISSFGAFLAGKWLDRQNQTKKLAHIRVFLDYLLSQNPIPELSDPGPPPLNFLFT